MSHERFNMRPCTVCGREVFGCGPKKDTLCDNCADAQDSDDPNSDIAEMIENWTATQ